MLLTRRWVLVSAPFPLEECAAAAPSSWVGTLGSPLPAAMGRAWCGRAGLAAGCPQISWPLFWDAGEGVSAPLASSWVLQQCWCGCCGWDGPSCGGIPVRRGAAPCPAVVMGVQLCRSKGLRVLLNLVCLLLSFPGAGRGFGRRGAAVLILPCRSKTPQLLVGACQLYRRSTG